MSLVQLGKELRTGGFLPEYRLGACEDDPINCIYFRYRLGVWGVEDRLGVWRFHPIYLLELSLTDTVSVEDDAGWLEACGLVEVDEELPHHGGQLLDNLLSVLLHPHRGGVAARVGVHAAYNLWDT